MSVKASISLTDQQESFARALVAEGRYPSLSAVLQQGLELLRERTESDALEREALRVLIAERRGGESLGVDAFEARLRDGLARRT